VALPGTGAIRACAASAPLRELRRAVRGPVLQPRSSARLVYNERYEAVRPLAVLQPLDVRDIQAAVRWAARHDVPIVARSGGHSYAGYSTARGALVVDLRRLHGVHLDAGSARVRVGGGAQLIDVYSRLARAGGTVPAGSCPSVGIAGLALAGGMGLAGRRFGLTCDNLAALTVVTADGEARRCDARTGPDLFWAHRGGGGGNFGIVASLELTVHGASSASWFFVSWPWSQASAALAAWQAFAPSTTSRLTSILSLSTGAGAPRATALGQYFGSVRALRALIAPLTRVSGARVSLGHAGYLSLMERWAGCLETSVAACHTVGASPGGALPRARFAARSDYVSRPLSSAGRAAMIELIERRQAQGRGSGAFLCDAYGGAINRVAPDATAFVHRDVLFSVQELAYFDAGAQAASLAWLHRAGTTLRPHASGEAYQGYIDPTLRSWRGAYYGENYERLVEVKRRYDPDRLFRFAQGVGA
jgi:FAD/FMN-containing dehydrogenase